MNTLKVATTRQVMEYLSRHPLVGTAFTYGIIREDESVLAFGRTVNGKKVREGSITQDHNGEGWLILSMDGAEEAHAKTLSDVHWFLWALDTMQSWPLACDWISSCDAAA